MPHRKIRIGIVGADTKASWAQVSHIPALRSHPHAELVAVATRHEESARAAAAAFGAQKWFADPVDMMRDETIDVVTVAVKVPAHRELVLAALSAGKAVYSEAPLGVSVEETEELASTAASRTTAIGLQGRLNPSVRRARDIIADGRIGEPLRARVVSTSLGFGGVTVSPYVYFDKADSGANLLTITAGHTLDIVESVLGDITEVDARADTLWPVVTVMDTGTTTAREVPDHADVLGRTASGAIFNASVVGGVPADDADFVFEVCGSEGWLRLTGGTMYGVQGGDLTLTSSAPFDAPDALVVGGGPADPAVNVAEVYASMARDLETARRDTPGFAHALHNARLIAAVARAAQSGTRQTLPRA
ncbi:Gfo/Idh/MocA family oxidoreductase [Streptomyces sp. NPDC046985]|uniref:Gfo/Idh/MocA family protein n=1 Tax=Streptomyces sp. NPDC046985 TaxID=3155377 RepID=UPI0033DBD45F